MGLYFISQPGQVVAIPLPNDVAMPLALTGWGGAFGFKSILTEIAVQQREGFQAQPTLNSRIFFSSFGPRPVPIRIGGLAFSAGCSGDQQTGIEYVMNYYANYKASAYGAPVVVAIGTTPAGVFNAFLTGLDTGINQPEARIAQFGLQLTGVPQAGT